MQNNSRTYIASILLIIITTLSPCAVTTGAQTTTRYDENDGLASFLVGGGVQDRNGLLWFATWNGLNCYDGYDFHWIRIQPGDKTRIATNHIRDILLAPDGNIFCHTDDDIYEFDLDTFSFRDVAQGVKDSLADKVGVNWPGLTDTQGNVWTSDRSGLYKTMSRHHPATLIEGTKGLNPRAFLVDRDGRLWIGTREDQSLRTYGPDGRLLETRHMGTTPYCLCQHSSGDIWVGGKPGVLMKLGGKSLTDTPIYDMKEDRRGRLWIATFGEGVKCIVNPTADVPTLSASFGGKKVRRLLITPHDNIVAATNDGLLIGHINPKDVAATRLQSVRRDGNDPRSLSSNSTMSLVQDSRGNIIIATESSGLNLISEADLFSGKPEFTHFNTRNSSLTSDIGNAMTLVADSLLLIVGSDNVMEFNYIDGRTVNLGRAFWNDTCRFAECTPVRLGDGRWIFGAKEGAFAATEHNINSRGYIPPLVFTTLEVNGEGRGFCLVPRESLSLDAPERNITIHFAALDYIDNTGILYRTRLDHSPWTGASRNRSVTLFNLPPGTHTLEVQSTDRYGRWVDNVRTLTVSVACFWYETWWATALFALIAAALLATAIYIIIYIRRMKRQQRELLAKYMKTVEEHSKSKEQRTAGNTADDMTPIAPEQKAEDTAFLNRVRRYIEENIANPDANINDMADAAAASRSTLNRRLNAMIGISAAQLLISVRLQHATRLLCEPENADRSIQDIACMCGYADHHYFQRAFKNKYGMTPAEYKAKSAKA